MNIGGKFTELQAGSTPPDILQLAGCLPVGNGKPAFNLLVTVVPWLLSVVWYGSCTIRCISNLLQFKRFTHLTEPVCPHMYLILYWMQEELQLSSRLGSN